MLDVILIASALAAPKPMHMPVMCGAASVFEKTISEKFSEKPVAMGIGANGQMMTLYTGADGSWTLMTRMANGNGCMVGSGNSLSILKPKFGSPS